MLKDSIVVAAKDQVYADIAGEVVILNLKSGMYYGLDPVGARIWELIQQPASVSQIRETLVTEYDVDPDLCERDLLVLLQRLSDAGLVEVTRETGA